METETIGRAGFAEIGVDDAVRLTIQGRVCTMDVREVPDDVPDLISQLRWSSSTSWSI
jgi:hypothetical protein